MLLTSLPGFKARAFPTALHSAQRSAAGGSGEGERTMTWGGAGRGTGVGEGAGKAEMQGLLATMG